MLKCKHVTEKADALVDGSTETIENNRIFSSCQIVVAIRSLNHRSLHHQSSSKKTHLPQPHKVGLGCAAFHPQANY